MIKDVRIFIRFGCPYSFLSPKTNKEAIDMNRRFFLRTYIPTLLCCLFLSSCDFYDNQSDCPTGQQFKFVYDKNIPGGNAFGAQVGYVGLYIFDKEGKYVTTLEDSGAALTDNNYRLQTNLPVGTYNIITWGRQDVNQSSFISNSFSTFSEMEKTLYTEIIYPKIIFLPRGMVIIMN